MSEYESREWDPSYKSKIEQLFFQKINTMSSYTLLCGHTVDLADVVGRAISADPDSDVCPVCQTKFSSYECCYLANCDTSKMTLTEFIEEEQRYIAKRTAELKANPPRKLQPRCSGTCKNGKHCTKVATRASGVFCNLHVPFY